MDSLLFPLLIVLLAVPLFLQARKQKRAVAEQQKLQNSLATGDRVMTTSGVFGTIVDTAEDTIELEIAAGVRTTWVRQAIREKVNPEQAEDATADSTDVVDAEPAQVEESKVEESKTEESKTEESKAN
ncbi:preprotein translocase subunit YajC [Saccharopolyspora sp. HNM0983]|uniref:Preprotein translocase subunit YajC n=1 Tax=Saccharopolyspora montiporae TaxID=2781240 RepID=A0A929B867_9PSEU|nr:preprotein translocase subunit YajC [Saccharopolyspora sp. HNM0983]MBE9373378.1 preprotein translocase subunit YajC [Saccharopolyspora sp. HNM0983]